MITAVTLAPAQQQQPESQTDPAGIAKTDVKRIIDPSLRPREKNRVMQRRCSLPLSGETHSATCQSWSQPCSPGPIHCPGTWSAERGGKSLLVLFGSAVLHSVLLFLSWLIPWLPEDVTWQEHNAQCTHLASRRWLERC